tara:strand:+ start:170 stop:760 length:591 start_codon:yes stop_codon:yes gene_type:complete
MDDAASRPATSDSASRPATSDSARRRATSDGGSTSSPAPPLAPLIFLDIDGVICCNYVGELQGEKLAQLKRICKATGAKVVLSSDWRRTEPLKQRCRRAFRRIKVEYAGCTPQQTVREHLGHWTIEKACRPQEITAWLRQYRSTWPGPYVAIDDRDLLGEVGGDELEGHFVQTSFSTGLTAAAADKAIAILQNEAS